jgi:hypothetical protein
VFFPFLILAIFDFPPWELISGRSLLYSVKLAARYAESCMGRCAVEAAVSAAKAKVIPRVQAARLPDGELIELLEDKTGYT